MKRLIRRNLLVKSMAGAGARRPITHGSKADWIWNTSGQSVAAVVQDFHALVLLSNIESVVIGPAQAQPPARGTARGRAQPAQVNRAVSLHALKSRLIELLASQTPLEQVLDELTQWFGH